MGKQKDLTPRKISQVKALMENTNLSQREIARRLNISPATITVLKRRLQFGSASPKRRGRCGPKRKTTVQTDRWLSRYSQKNRRLSSNQLKQELINRGCNISSSTVRKRLLADGVGAYQPVKKPHLTARMKRQRLQWAKQFEKWTAEDWERYVLLQMFLFYCHLLIVMVVY